MNKMTIIGNLTKDPDKRTTQDGTHYCCFTVAVRKRYHKEGTPDADFVRVTAWRGLGDSCAQYLAKGRKVAVSGPATVSAYLSQDGQPRAQLEIQADDVEFLSPRGQASDEPTPPPEDGGGQFTDVSGEDVPW